jgi:hypothetical protein
MKKLFAILIMVLCVAAFSSFDIEAKKNKTPKAKITHVSKGKKGGKCSKCGGKGKIKCSRCGGKGKFISDSGFAYSVSACSSCGGHGSYTDAGDPYYDNTTSRSGFRKGSGRKTCPSCKGRGYK